MITSLLYLTMDRSWQVQLVWREQEPRNPLWQTDCRSDPFYFLVTKSSVSVITNALIISNCPQTKVLRGENHFGPAQISGLTKLCFDANSWSLYLSTSLELTSASGEFLKLIQQSDCVWVQPDINWTPDLFIGRKNGNCKKNIGLLSW